MDYITAIYQFFCKNRGFHKVYFNWFIYFCIPKQITISGSFVMVLYVMLKKALALSCILEFRQQEVLKSKA